jgi:hypothetical protein
MPFSPRPSLIALPSGQMLSPAIHRLLGSTSNICPRIKELGDSSQGICRTLREVAL